VDIAGVTDLVEVLVATSFAAATSMTVTYTPEFVSPVATGLMVAVLRISGMTLAGASAVRQIAADANKDSGTTPSHAFAQNALTGNPTIGVIFTDSNPPTVTPPTGWSTIYDLGYDTPTTGLQVVSRNSGFTGSSITWGGVENSNFAEIILELDASSVQRDINSRRGSVGLRPYLSGSVGSRPLLLGHAGLRG
jgi:hypothetical protein